MARRIPIKTTILTNARRLEVMGYKAARNGRFGVIRHRDGEGPWIVVHLRTGVGVGSCLPASCVSLSEKLAAVAKWEAATHLDWSAFDELPEIGPDSTAMPRIDQAKAGPTVRAMAGLAS